MGMGWGSSHHDLHICALREAPVTYANSFLYASCSGAFLGNASEIQLISSTVANSGSRN